MGWICSVFLTAELISEGRGTKKFHILRLAEHEPGLPWLFSGKESAFNTQDQGPIPGSGRPPGEGNGNPLQYSCLENSMDTEGPGRLPSMYHKELDMTEPLRLSLLCPNSLSPPLLEASFWFSWLLQSWRRGEILNWSFTPNPILREMSLFDISSTSPGEVTGDPLQYSCLETPMDGGAW